MEIKEIIEKIPDIKVLSGPFQGGQKEVYKCEINGKENALKFIKSTVAGDEGEIRCEREINTLSMCNSKHLIKLGEIPYTEVSEGRGIWEKSGRKHKRSYRTSKEEVL